MKAQPIQQALLLAPQGRDAVIAAAILNEIDVSSVTCSSVCDLRQGLSDQALFAVITEESIAGADLKDIAQWVSHQPSWSDLPFVVLTHVGGGVERNPNALRLGGILGNVTFLERPFHPTTFISVARAALRGRQRQFDARLRMHELRESEARVSTALLAGRLGPWELDCQRMELLASAEFKEIFGRSSSSTFELADLVSAVHQDDRPRMLQSLRRSIANLVDYVEEFRLLWPDGTVHWAELRARAVRNGDSDYLVGVSSEVTPRKTAEQLLREANESLEIRVRERTLELEAAHNKVLAEIAQREKAEEQLRQAQKIESIGQLTGGVAHDFNNLLMAVLANLELLDKLVGSDPKAARLIDVATQGARRGAALTQRLLAFARRQDLRVQPTNVAKLIESMSELLLRSVGPGISLTFNVNADVPNALIDANQVELALLNLVVNSRDAMPRGGELTVALDSVRLDATDDVEPGSFVRLSVVDTGSGMDADTLARAIDPFFSTKELGKGTGLGLSMIHGLAVQLRGSLRLSSTPGKGTRAELLMPATHESPAPATLPDARAGAPENAADRLRVLIVDDDAIVCMTTLDMLEDLGHEVVAAESGAAALAILESPKELDLMVTDFAMPRMTGVQLSKEARKLRPALPIILATGYAELPAALGVELLRMAKPYTQEQLQDAIAKVTETELSS